MGGMYMRQTLLSTTHNWEAGLHTGINIYRSDCITGKQTGTREKADSEKKKKRRLV